MIKKNSCIVLSKEEVDSPEPIEITLEVMIEGEEESVEYTISYPKDSKPKLPTKEEILEFLKNDEECNKIKL